MNPMENSYDAERLLPRTTIYRLLGIIVATWRLARASRYRKEGFTYDVVRGSFLDPRYDPQAYGVALPGYGHKLRSRPTALDWFIWLALNWGTLSSGLALVGYWVQIATGLHFIDLSEVVFGPEEASRLLRERGEQCVYHYATGRDVYLDELEVCE